MIEMQTLIRFADKGFVLKLFLLLLLFSLFPIAEVLLFFHVGAEFGNYFVLACAVGTGLLGLAVATRQAWKIITRIRTKTKDGEYPRRDVQYLAGILVAGFFLLIPGFITDFLGLLFLLPLFRNPLGRGITRSMEPRLKQAYEYLKVYDL
jgi:UPF0716 protein FxsA